MEAQRDAWPFWPASPVGADPARLYVAQTGHALTPAAARAWAGLGGVALLGWPISEEFARDGTLRQHFERGVIVWSPEGAASLALIGREHAALLARSDPAARAALAPYTCRPPDAPAPQDAATGAPGGDVRPPCPADARLFPETGHSLRGAFGAFWDAHGGVAQFGYPISEEFTLNGQIVQYFERARIELGPGGEVRLSRLGAELAGR